MSDCTIASSPPSSSSAEQATEPSVNNQNFTTVGRQPVRSKTPPKQTRYGVTNTFSGSQREGVNSPTSNPSPKPSGFLRRLKGKSSGTYNVTS